MDSRFRLGLASQCHPGPKGNVDLITANNLTLHASIFRTLTTDRQTREETQNRREMSEETLDSGQPALKYMTVPEKIELTPGTSGGEIHEPPNRYRPMRVPDTITLEATTPAVAPSGAVDVEVGEPGVLMTDRHGQGPVGDAGRRLRRAMDPTPVDIQPPAHAQ